MSDADVIVRHAEHFLLRLDRLNTREVDLALGLYRASGLLRSVLQQVALPEAAARVAVSLGDPSRANLPGPLFSVYADGLTDGRVSMSHIVETITRRAACCGSTPP